MLINSREYWNGRFASGDWAAQGGRSQTRSFALAQVPRLGLPDGFAGSLLDFGCGLGDAIPVYTLRWPNAKLLAVDFSNAAIDSARNAYGHLAAFHVADHATCPTADVIIASNVIEHLEDDEQVVRILQQKCRTLFVVVPFEEQPLIKEHRHRYDRQSFKALGVTRVDVFACPGWSEYGLRARWWGVSIKNLVRPFVGELKVRRRLQAIYHLPGRFDR